MILMTGFLFDTATSDSLSHWASVVTLLAEGLVIAGMVVGGVAAVIRWQKKKDRLEEEENRAVVRDEVASQLNEFKRYFELKFDGLSNGVQRTVSAVERNSGSSIPDALFRLERAVANMGDNLGEVHEHLEKLDEEVKSLRDV